MEAKLELSKVGDDTWHGPACQGLERPPMSLGDGSDCIDSPIFDTSMCGGLHSEPGIGVAYTTLITLWEVLAQKHFPTHDVSTTWEKARPRTAAADSAEDRGDSEPGSPRDMI